MPGRCCCAGVCGPDGADGRAGESAAVQYRGRLAGPRRGTDAPDRRDRARRDESVGGRTTPASSPAAVRAVGLGLHRSPHPGRARRDSPGEDRKGAGAGAPARVEPAALTAGRLPLADGGGQAADRLDRHRPRRHHHHVRVQEDRDSGHLHKGVRVSSAGRVVREHHRIAGDASASGECRSKHGGRPRPRAHRHPRPDSRFLGREDPRPCGRGRGHPTGCWNTSKR